MIKESLTFVWRITASHVIAYFLAGLFAVTFLRYRENYASAYLSGFMRQVSDPIVALGPSLQVFRGIIIGLILLPLKDVFIGGNRGYLKLGLLILGLSALSPIGPAPGSIEGIIYTILPLKYHMLGWPETLLYLALFLLLLRFFHRNTRPAVPVLTMVALFIIILMSGMGYLAARGYF